MSYHIIHVRRTRFHVLSHGFYKVPDERCLSEKAATRRRSVTVQCAPRKVCTSAHACTVTCILTLRLTLRRNCARTVHVSENQHAREVVRFSTLVANIAASREIVHFIKAKTLHAALLPRPVPVSAPVGNTQTVSSGRS